DFSGGLDSSSLAVLASAVAGEVPALTVATEGVDDVAVAAEAARQVPTLRHHVIAEPSALLPYADLERTPLTDEPWLGAVTSARERWWMQQVCSAGSDLHLSGDGGDGVLLATPAYLADLVSARQGRALWRHAVASARPWRCAAPAIRRRATTPLISLPRTRAPGAGGPGWSPGSASVRRPSGQPTKGAPLWRACCVSTRKPVPTPAFRDAWASGTLP